MLNTENARNAEQPHGHGEVLIRRDDLKVSRLTLPKDGNLPEHSVVHDLIVVVVRGSGVFTVRQEIRHVTAGDVLDFIPGESHSIDAETEMELVLVDCGRAHKAA